MVSEYHKEGYYSHNVELNEEREEEEEEEESLERMDNLERKFTATCKKL